MSFVSFARAHGLILDYAEPDGRWHRTKTIDKQHRRNGAFLWDGTRGVVKNFATMENYAAYREGVRIGEISKSELRARRVMAEAETKAKQTEARALADDMLKRAALATHPYLVAKGFPEERGLVLDGELLIPMREFSRYSQLNSLQRIAADGSKLFLSGGRAKSSVFFIGSGENWLCEGYATGLSIRDALRFMGRKARVVVCFSAGNLAHIGRAVAASSMRAFVFADNDKSGAGQKAAEETGLLWVMAQEEGTDANDLHQRDGISALVHLIRGLNAVRQHEGAA